MASSKAPRVAAAGPLIATEPTEPQAKLDFGGRFIISATDTAHARRLAQAQLAAKPDFIKIWGIGSGPQGAAQVRDMTRAVAEVAHGAGIRVAVHATDLAIAEAALAGGADILVHSVEDAPLPAAFLQTMKARGTVYVTTAMVMEGYYDAFLGRPDLTAVERKLGAPDIIQSLTEMPAGVIAQTRNALPADSLKEILLNAKAAVAAGVRVAAGTDAGNIGTLHGPALHRELQLLSRAGLTPAQVLTAATRDAAFAYSPKPDIGLIAPGYRADLLVLDADPLASVTNLTRIATVWSRGRPLNPGTLLKPTPESVVQLQLERYNAKDVEGFLATYSDDAEIFDRPGQSAAAASGKAALRKIYSGLFAKQPQVICRVPQRTVEGRFVIDQEVCARTPDSKPVHATAIYEVIDAKIRRVWFAAADSPKT